MKFDTKDEPETCKELNIFLINKTLNDDGTMGNETYDSSDVPWVEFDLHETINKVQGFWITNEIVTGWMIQDTKWENFYFGETEQFHD